MRIALILALCPAPVLAGPNVTADPSVFSDIAAGIVCSGGDVRRAPAPDTHLGFIDLVDGPIYVALPTRRVPALAGLAFGVVGTVGSGVDPANLTVIVTHPPMGANRITRETWSSDLAPDGMVANFFTFDYPEERVPGPWTLQATLNGRVLYTAAFDVVDPGAIPGFVDPCEEPPQIS